MTLLLVIGNIEVPSTIRVASIIKAAVAVTEGMTIGLHAIPGGPIPGVPLILVDPNLHLDPAEGTDPIHTVEASLDQGLMEGMAITPEVVIARSPQIANVLNVTLDHP